MATSSAAPVASSSGAPAQLNPDIVPDNLTYGVELEFVFAFHQDELVLREHLDGTKDTIVKDMRYTDREAHAFTPISSVDLPNRIYNSWGIDQVDPKSGVREVVPYSIEPMEILGRKLYERYPSLRFTSDSAPTEQEKTKDKYDQWLVTADLTVCGVGSKNIPRGVTYVTPDDAKDWDSYGIEVVSRVLNSNSPDDRAEITRVVEALRANDDPKSGAFITNQCGLHVHVQAPSDLNVLKELAVILIVYEEEIAKLHPPCRRPNHAATIGIAESNRMGIMEHPEDKNTRLFDASTKALIGKHGVHIERIRQDVRRIMDKKELARYMNAPARWSYPDGNRHRQVNFLSLVRGDDYPSTIEFRQARGSLRPKDILMWVDFCLGLVRLAHLYHAKPDLFPTDALDDYYDERGELLNARVDVFDLIQDMGLSADAVRYWELTKALYASGMIGDENDRTDNELSPPEPTDYPDDESGGSDDEDKGEGDDGDDGEDEEEDYYDEYEDEYLYEDEHQERWKDSVRHILDRT